MATSFKATAEAYQVTQDLASRLSEAAVGSSLDLSVVMSFASDGNPLITVGTLGIGNACALIKLMPMEQYPALNVFNQAAEQFVPIKMMICTEANPAGGVGADILAPGQLAPILAEGPYRGIRTEWYNSANGAAPSEGGMVAANLKAVFDSIYWPGQLSQ